MTNDMKQPPNPSAFPHPGVCGGMSLRDYFAAAALSFFPYDVRDSPANVAQRAYALADAMLAARGGENDGHARPPPTQVPDAPR